MRRKTYLETLLTPLRIRIDKTTCDKLLQCRTSLIFIEELNKDGQEDMYKKKGSPDRDFV